MTTETGMVARCARAMQNSPAWPAVFDAGSAEVLTRAVLECLRTPTPEMAEAGLRALQDNLGHSSVIIRDADACFAAMIDAALSPSKGEPTITYPPELLPTADGEAEVIVIDPDTRKETVVWPAPSKGEGK